jgi:hypothetical protein
VSAPLASRLRRAFVADAAPSAAAAPPQPVPAEAGPTRAAVSWLRRTFLEAPGGTAAPPPDVVSRAPSVAVLAGPGEATAAGAALGLALTRRHGVPAALVLRWDAAGAAQAGATQLAVPAARRIAETAGRVGCEAAARGRLAHAVLPGDADEAIALTRTVLGRVPAPAVLVLEGPRPAVWDDLLAAHDGLVVALGRDAAAPLADVALASAAALGRPAAVLELPSGPLRALPDGGLALPPPLRRAAHAALDAVEAAP